MLTILKGVLHLLPKLACFVNEHLLEKLHMHLIVICSRNSKMAKCFLSYRSNSQNVVWINNSRSAWLTLMLMLFLSSLHILLFKQMLIILR